MDVEVAKSDSLLPKEENGVLHQNNGIGGPIRFGSHGVDEPKAKVGTNGPENNFPVDAVDEWPAPQQVHSFYFVKYRPYENPELKAKLDKADADIQRKSQLRSQIFEKIKAKKSCRAELIAQLRPLRDERRQMWSILDEKAKEIKPLNQALGQLRNPNGSSREKGVIIFSSEQELNNHIKSLEYRIQHESISLPEEKQILREIKQLESTRGKVAANAAMMAKIQESMGEKEALQDQVNLMGVDLKGVKKDKEAVNAKIKPLEEECKKLDDEIENLNNELKVATEKQQEANTVRNNLLKERDGGNTSHYQNRAVLNKAKELAAKKDIEAVKELDNLEMEKFMSQWNSDKAFRDDYEKRILSSLDFRQLSRDGRIRNPDEKPLVPVTQNATAFTSTVGPAKTNAKQAKENHVSSSPQVVQKEEKAILTKESKKKETGSAIATVPVDLEGEKDSGFDKLAKDSQPKPKEVDEAKSKEMKREEELAKAKQALERKKKLAEKAAAKAAIKAQKEAEKKLKEREKKAKKKAAASGTLPEPEERPADEESEATEEAEKVEEDIKSPVPSKNKPRKENAARLRTKPRGPEALPRAILKRKRSTNYWVWAVPAAAVAAGLVVLAVGYTYFI